MKHPASFNAVTIDLDELCHNYRFLRDTAGSAIFLAMVKADGYGHGMLECSEALEKAGCTHFGVAELPEAVKLRQGGTGGAIFSMVGFDPADAGAFAEFDITPVVYDVEGVKALSRAAQQAGKDICVHVKVDTGMDRLGVRLDEIDGLLKVIDDLPRVVVGGMASHFPCADDRDSKSTRQCYEKFKKFQKHASSLSNPVHHIANSGGTLYFPPGRCDMVRCGISLYGYYPEGREGVVEDGLHPVMSFSTRVVAVKDVPAGAGVSYGHTFVTTRKTRLAVLPVGYEDGFSRLLSNRGEVLIRGRRAPIRGRVCMNLCMVDVTDIEGVATGDEAVTLGRQGRECITADEIAAHIDTISYEVLCMLGNNNDRKYQASSTA